MEGKQPLTVDGGVLKVAFSVNILFTSAVSYKAAYHCVTKENGKVVVIIICNVLHS